VNWITSDGFSLRDVHRERVGDILVGTKFSNGQGADKMGQQLQSWRSGTWQNHWLSMLIETMETVSRPEYRAVPCDRSVLVAFRAHLARPVISRAGDAPRFSLRN
jgi:hypothetical protein